MPNLPKFTANTTTTAAAFRLIPAGRGAFLVTVAGATLGRVRLMPSRDGAPCAWVHGASFAHFASAEAAAFNLYATKAKRERGRVRVRSF